MKKENYRIEQFAKNLEEIFCKRKTKILKLNEIYKDISWTNFKKIDGSEYKDLESQIRRCLQWNAVNSKIGKKIKSNKLIFRRRGGGGYWELIDANLCEIKNYQQKDSIFKYSILDEYQEKIRKIINNIDLNIDQDQKWSIVNYKIFNRNKNLVYEIRKRANNKCEYCEKETFRNKQDENYLEVHHINFLCEGGKDELNNLIALCPNCHRKAHFYKEKEIFKEQLINKKNKLIKL